MTKAMVHRETLALQLKDRLDLINDLDLSIIENETVVQIPASHKRYLEEILTEQETHPSKRISHEEMMEHLRQLKRRLAAKRAGKST